MKEMKVTATRAKTKPNYRKTAPELLGACRLFYENPENEEKFQEWLQEIRKEERKNEKAI
ncbi:MAG: hypothetical protein II008_03530 [Oscillospiraceae bacterium]|nr:hypothetical protein [Oscillospiraceae bacterium]